MKKLISSKIIFCFFIVATISSCKQSKQNDFDFSNIKLPKKITAQPDQVGKAIFNAVKKKTNIVYVSPIWRIIMMIIRNIPEQIFKKMNL